MSDTTLGLTPMTPIGNPAAVAWEWTDRDTGTTYQVTWIRGAHSLILGMRRDGGEWVTTGMDRERWAVNGTQADAKRAVEEFYALAIAAHTDSDA